MIAFWFVVINVPSDGLSPSGTRISAGTVVTKCGSKMYTGPALDSSLISRFVGPTWGPPGADRTQVAPMLAPWTLLPGFIPHRVVRIVDMSKPLRVFTTSRISREGVSNLAAGEIIQAQIYNDGVWSLKMKRQCIWHDMVVLYIKLHGKWAAMSSPSLGQISSYWIKVRTQVRYPAGVNAPLCPQSTSSWIASHQPEAYG